MKDAIELLDELLNGSHLDDIPNHNDDSLFDLRAAFPQGSWGFRILTEHIRRVQRIHEILKGADV